MFSNLSSFRRKVELLFWLVAFVISSITLRTPTTQASMSIENRTPGMIKGKRFQQEKLSRSNRYTRNQEDIIWFHTAQLMPILLVSWYLAGFLALFYGQHIPCPVLDIFAHICHAWLFLRVFQMQIERIHTARNRTTVKSNQYTKQCFPKLLR